MPRQILIVGGGVAALEAAVALRTLGGDRVSPVVLTPSTDFAFRARDVGAPFRKPQSSRIPLADVLGDLMIPHICDAVSSIDTGAREVHTLGGLSHSYDGMLVAVGGTPFPAYAHGISFDRSSDPGAFDELLADVEGGLVDSVAFIAPESTGWTLPAYDLALMLSAWAQRHETELAVSLVTAEESPLECFGLQASRRVAEVLDRAGIHLVRAAEPVLVSDTTMTAAGHWITADRIVSLPRLAGPRLRGLPCDPDGFIEVDANAAVPGCDGVYAAGDGVAHARKQGGLAAREADVAARALLRDAGLRIPDSPDPPVLRGALATTAGPLYLEAGVADGSRPATSIATLQPLWDPPGKVATRWLGPFIAGLVLRRLEAFAA
jgi:sulfide:quinone oxidoreductase